MSQGEQFSNSMTIENLLSSVKFNTTSESNHFDYNIPAKYLIKLGHFENDIKLRLLENINDPRTLILFLPNTLNLDFIAFIQTQNSPNSICLFHKKHTINPQPFLNCFRSVLRKNFENSSITYHRLLVQGSNFIIIYQTETVESFYSNLDEFYSIFRTGINQLYDPSLNSITSHHSSDSKTLQSLSPVSNQFPSPVPTNNQPIKTSYSVPLQSLPLSKFVSPLGFKPLIEADCLQGLFWSSETQNQINTLFLTRSRHITSSFPQPGSLNEFNGSVIQSILSSGVPINGLIGNYDLNQNNLVIHWKTNSVHGSSDLLTKAKIINNQLVFLESVFTLATPFDPNHSFKGIYKNINDPTEYFEFKTNGYVDIFFPFMFNFFESVSNIYTTQTNCGYKIEYHKFEIQAEGIVKAFNIARVGDGLWIEGSVFMSDLSIGMETLSIHSNDSNSAISSSSFNSETTIIPKNFNSITSLRTLKPVLINRQSVQQELLTPNRLQSPQQDHSLSNRPSMIILNQPQNPIHPDSFNRIRESIQQPHSNPNQSINSNINLPGPRLFGLSPPKPGQIEGLYLGLGKNKSSGKWLPLTLIYTSQQPLVFSKVPNRGHLSLTDPNFILSQMNSNESQSKVLSGMYIHQGNNNFMIKWNNINMIPEYDCAIPAFNESRFNLDNKSITFQSNEFNTDGSFTLVKARSFPHEGVCLQRKYHKQDNSDMFIHFNRNGTVDITCTSLLSHFKHVHEQLIYSLGHYSLELINGMERVAFTVYLPQDDDEVLIIEGIPYLRELHK